MKRIITIISVLVITSISGYVYYQQSQPKFLGSINYGFNDWPGNLPNLVAYDMGFFKKNGLDVKMVKEDNYTKLSTDFNEGKVDFGDLALIDVVEDVGQGSDTKIVLAQDFSNGADGIVAKKDIKLISDLKGKKIAVAKGTLSEYLLQDALNKHELNLSDIQIIDLQAPEAAQAFVRGEVDAAVTWEPDYSNAVEKGNGWKIYTSADSPGVIVDTVAFRGDYIKNNHDKVAAVVKSYFDGVDFIKTNPEKAYEIGAKYLNISVDDFKLQYSGVEQVSLVSNLKVMSFGSNSNSLHEIIENTVDYLLEGKMIKDSVDSTDIIDHQFIRELSI